MSCITCFVRNIVTHAQFRASRKHVYNDKANIHTPPKIHFVGAGKKGILTPYPASSQKQFNISEEQQCLT